MPGSEIIDKKERKALNKLFLDGGILSSIGSSPKRKNFHVREFEKKICRKFNSKYALAVTSGTAAIKIGLKSLGLKKNDEVVTQAFNFIATIEAILDLGAKPVLVGVDKTLNMCPKLLMKRITNKTKAIIPVHMLGVAAKMNEILNISRKFNIPILEDTCEAFGAKYGKKYLSLIGDVGVASFDGGKIITCGEGGAILTNNKSIDKYCREYHDHGHENNPKLPRGQDTRTIYGFNYRMTEMQGIIGKVQLQKLDFIIKNNKLRYNHLNKIIKKKFEIRQIPKKSTPIFDTFIFFENNPLKRKKILEKIKKNHFGTKNLPDAIKWHCSAYWMHALTKKQIRNSIKTKKLLNTAIAIPINLKRTIKDYIKLAQSISSAK